jgi:hypothetical protein
LSKRAYDFIIADKGIIAGEKDVKKDLINPRKPATAQRLEDVNS